VVVATMSAELTSCRRRRCDAVPVVERKVISRPCIGPGIAFCDARQAVLECQPLDASHHASHDLPPLEPPHGTHSVTWAAISGERVMPRACAVLTLTTKSNMVGC
jgi:hypothetical protein